MSRMLLCPHFTYGLESFCDVVSGGGSGPSMSMAIPTDATLATGYARSYTVLALPRPQHDQAQKHTHHPRSQPLTLETSQHLVTHFDRWTW